MTSSTFKSSLRKKKKTTTTINHDQDPILVDEPTYREASKSSDFPRIIFKILNQ